MRFAIATRNAELDAFAALCNSGTINIYNGTRPATSETAVSGQTLLASPMFGATAFGAGSNGKVTANAISDDAAAAATGTASWFRIIHSDGSTAVADGSVGTSSSDLNLNSTAIQEDATVEITSMTVELPQGT